MKKKYKILLKNYLKYFLFTVPFIIIWKYYYNADVVSKKVLYEANEKEISDMGVIDHFYQVTLPKSKYVHLPILINDLDKLQFINQFNSSVLRSYCPFISPYLVGKLSVDEKALTQNDLEEKFADDFEPQSGGHWRPSGCLPQSKVAIIVPYRDRDAHLRLFLNHMHKFLRSQLIEYAIYIIEEVAQIPFNRAMLMNIGYNEAIKDNDWDCFVFHDVDLVPEDDRNLYHCPYFPRHMSSNVNTFGYVLPYKEILGGVTAISRKHFEKVNGFSNSYFGWGGEDDDFAERVLSHNLKIIRYPDYISRYFMLAHKKDIPSKQRFNLLESAKKRFKTDGLNSLRYKVESKGYKRLFTWILVSFDYPNKMN